MVASVFAAIATTARQRPEAIALGQGARTITYGALQGFLAACRPYLQGPQQVIGIATSDPLEAALADLALTACGHISVNLPPFFSTTQKAHIIQAAGLTAVIGQDQPDLPQITLPAPPAAHDDLEGFQPIAGAKRIIFTSGSSGTPKGVVIGETQMQTVITGLRDAIAPDARDVHLSLLPIAQLLEQVAGLYLPLLCGARIEFCAAALAALSGGDPQPVITTMINSKPSTTILVPALLSVIVAHLKSKGIKAPDSFRFVAVGGAHTSPSLLEQAADLGLPVYEGYGLSECGSVVAMNRVGALRHGTVGKILSGVNAWIDNGEIVVSGPSVMEGYLGAPAPEAPWRTGDLGRIEDGYLIIEGRKDWLIVTPAGRNINPEWVEACLGADPRIVAAGLWQTPQGELEILAALRGNITPEHIATHLAALPSYARPASVIMVPANLPNLLKAGGGIARNMLSELSKTAPKFPLTYPAKEYA